MALANKVTALADGLYYQMLPWTVALMMIIFVSPSATWMLKVAAIQTRNIIRIDKAARPDFAVDRGPGLPLIAVTLFVLRRTWAPAQVIGNSHVALARIL